MAVTLTPVPRFPMVQPGDDLAALLIAACEQGALAPADGDVVVVAQKIVSKAEGRYVDLAQVRPSAHAEDLAAQVDKDPRLVEVILGESRRVVRHRPGVLIVEHRLGFIMANAGVDRSNVDPALGTEPVLLLPRDPDASAAHLRDRLGAHFRSQPAVIVTDSWGRAWRRGTVGIALGAAGLPALMDLRGRSDLFGHELRVTETGFADEIASAASLIMGQADEAQPVVLVRGLVLDGCGHARRIADPPAGRGFVPVNGSTTATPTRSLVVALSGGIGGAKLVLGLSRVMAPADLVVVANTGDDFEHLGLAISPDLDTVMYVLAGLDDQQRGWGRRDETWSFMAALATLGGETWFQLGDGDLATHVERTRRRASGETLSAVTADFCRRLGIVPRIVPMSDDKVRTRLRTGEGWLDFQDYFVHRRCAPAVMELAYDGAATAHAQSDALAALRDPRLRAVVICPSNPFISIEPILAVPGMREAIATCDAPVVAVSPIIGGRAVKGPTAKMMAELGLTVNAASAALRYGDLLDGYVVDHADADEAAALGIPVTMAHTLMTTLDEREQLARDVLATADALANATV